MLPFTATWMDLKGIMLSEIKVRPEKDKHRRIPRIGGVGKIP